MSATIKKYYEAFVISQQCLDKLQIEDYPINVSSIINELNKPNILLQTLSDYISWSKIVNGPSWIAPYIKDARCIFSPDHDVYLIIYNEKQPAARVRFSMIHELAHILLGHLSDKRTEMSRGGLPDPLYYAMEGAANTFAGNFLAPPIIINEFMEKKRFSWFDAMKLPFIFGLSQSAVRDYRQADYKYWVTTTPSSTEQRILKRYLNRSRILLCRHGHLFRAWNKWRFCPICGDKHLKTIKGECNVIYDGLELNESMRMKICQKCGNEEIDGNHNYCKICGSIVINQCYNSLSPDTNDDCIDECSHPLPGNARCCPYCGGLATFVTHNFLERWDDEQKSFTDIPDEDFSF